jgi:hypothetical protein
VSRKVVARMQLFAQGVLRCHDEREGVWTGGAVTPSLPRPWRAAVSREASSYGGCTSTTQDG